MRKVPFDSVCLRAIETELQPLVGAKAQRWVVLGRWAIGVQLYDGREHWLLISASPEHGRVHLLSGRPERRDPTQFVTDLRTKLPDSTLATVKQRHMDRILDLSFSMEGETFVLTAEIMGKHSNIVLRDSHNRTVAALKWVGAKHSRRPILPGKPYEEPFEPVPAFFRSAPEDAQVSPFLRDLISADGFDSVAARVRERQFGAFARDDGGAYPLAFSGATTQFKTFSQALESGAQKLEHDAELERVRASLAGQLDRIVLAREVALNDLRQAADTASRAAAIQRQAELIQAYASMAEPGADHLDVWDYEGTPITIKLLSHLSALENAQRLFEKARRAKLGSSGVHEQIARLEQDYEIILDTLSRLRQATSIEEIEDLTDEARKRKWLTEGGAAKPKEERPYEGHAIREVRSPAGWTVLYGDNATSNDYLTQKVAKPNDLWLHVRGGVSAHVVIRTGNQPDKVQKADLIFAAQIAVRHSPQKHAKYVPVDYTLKKYVRKPRGSAAGSVVYEREKTLHVDP